jgi:4-amino-4-deoxy-L-arabinose transferase-like glycosyltransferase
MSRLVSVIGLCALAAIAFGLRLAQIDQSLFGDELFTYSDVHGHSFASVLHTVQSGGENSPPLYFELAWASAKLGDPSVFVRLPSVVLGTATVPLVYALGRETVGRTAGLIGAAVVALSPSALFYGVEARPYATMVFFVALSTLALVRAVGTRSWWWWALYAVSAAAAAYTHYTCVFVLGVQAIWSLWACRDRLAQPLVANAVVGLLYLPWLSRVHGNQLDVFAALTPLSVRKVLDDLLRAVAGYPNAPLREIPSVLGLVAIGACTLTGLVALVLRWRQNPPGAPQVDRAPRLALLGALAAATPIGLLLYSLLVTNLFGSRGLLASLPAAVLVLGALLASLPRPLTVITAGVLSAALLTGTIRSFTPPRRRDAVKDIARFIDARAGARAAVVYVPFFGLVGGVGPLRHDLDIYLSPRVHLETLPNPTQLAGLWRSAPQVFVVGPRVGAGVFAPGPPPAQHRRLLARTKFDGIHPYVVFHYGPASPRGGAGRGRG